jgi:hydrogenase expression/formation protein HypC
MHGPPSVAASIRGQCIFRRSLTSQCSIAIWLSFRSKAPGKIISGDSASERQSMCLGIPGKVLDTYGEHDVLMGRVDFSGVVKRVCLEHVPQVQPGEYVLVHVGFALSRIDEAEATQVFEFLRQMNQLGELEEAPP